MVVTKPKNSAQLTEVVTARELDELIARMVGIWVGEMQRADELRPTATVEELEDFKRRSPTLS
jgi:hypothetical protein